MKAFIWGIVVILLITSGHLWPREGSLWLVILAENETPNTTLKILDGTTSTLVEVVDSHKLVIKASKDLEPAFFYEKGAILVVNAVPGFGCSSSLKNKWAKKKDS